MNPAAVRVIAALGVTYVVSQFFRSSNAVIAPDLARDADLSPEALGALTGAFFLAFAIAQIPVGVLLDRFGPRRTISALLAFAVAGSLVFATAPSFAGLALGRAMTGLGCAGVFMGAVVVCARWFPADRLATASAIVLVVGGAGSLLSTTPLALATDAVGWRGAFVGMAAITAAVALLVVFAVRDAPPGHPFHTRKRQTLRAVLRGVRDVLANRQLPFILVMSFVAYPALATVITLWAGPYLHDVHGLDGVGRGNVLLAMAAATIVGTACYGPLDRALDTRKGVVVCAALIVVTILSLLALIPRPALWQSVLLLTLLGLFGPYAIIVMAHGRSIFPESLVGRAVTVVNFVNFSGVAVMQMATGLIIGAFPATDGAAPEAAYRLVFAFLAATLVVAAAIYSRAVDAKPSRGVPGEDSGQPDGNPRMDG